MQPRILLSSCFLCWILLLAQHGEGLFFTDGGASTAWVIGGSTAAGSANLALLGGLVVAKAVGLGVLALILSRRGRKSSGRRRSGRYRYRGKREAGFSGDEDIDDIDENDIAIIKSESEMVFRQLEEMDPAHCFRRYVCDLSTGKLQNVTTDHLSILNLVAQPFTEKTTGFEYSVAASLGQRFGSIDVCEVMYNCPMPGQQITQLLH